MKQSVTASNEMDDDGNPAGGCAHAQGVNIRWQNGPLAVDGVRKEPNGAFVETIIEIAISRLRFYQNSKFRCSQNERAISNLFTALDFLNERTAEREARGVEGTHTP